MRGADPPFAKGAKVGPPWFLCFWINLEFWAKSFLFADCGERTHPLQSAQRMGHPGFCVSGLISKFGLKVFCLRTAGSGPTICKRRKGWATLVFVLVD
jgi:hypothetical protein